MTVRLLIVCGGSGKNLLGQRGVLGIHGELYVDVMAEVRSRLRAPMDYFSQVIELDRYAQTTGLVFQEARWRVAQSADEADDRHLQMLMDHLPASVPLDRGLDMLPALGGLAIRHSQNKVALEQALEEMTTQLGVGPQNPLEVWIVSSTVGGVGGGTHRFLGTFLMDFVQRRYVGTSVKLNFVRVGPRSSWRRNPRQAALNAFLGIAADSALALSLSRDYPGAVTQWFYMDVATPSIDELRAVEMAVKALMWEDMQEDLQYLLSYNRGVPMGLFRAGSTARQIDQERTYYELLRHLLTELQDLVEPDYDRKYLTGGQEPAFVADALAEWLDRASDEQNLSRQIEAGWRLPLPKGHANPRRLEDLRNLVTVWLEAIQTLVGGSWNGLYGGWFVEDGLSREPLRVAEPGELPPGSDHWFRQVEQAHRARAWALRLLGCDERTGQIQQGLRESRVNTLLTQARDVSSLLHGFNPLSRTEARIRRAKDLLREFVRTLVEVQSLVLLEAKARQFLDAELAPVRAVLGVAETEFRRLYAQWEEPDYSAYAPRLSGALPFSSGDRLAEAHERLKDKATVRNRVRAGWRSPVWWRFPATLRDLRGRVEEWRNAVRALVGIEWEWGTVGRFLSDTSGAGNSDGQGQARVLGDMSREQDGTWSQIEVAHLSRAWVRYLLGCNLRDGVPLRRSDTLVGRVRRQTQRVAVLWFLERIGVGSIFKQVEDALIRNLGDLLMNLAQIETLLQVDESAAQLLDQELRKGSLVLGASLHERPGQHGRSTWLQNLCDSVRQPDIIRFREAVSQGASGLTERGLRRVLNLSAGASAREIHRELLFCTDLGRNSGAEVESVWSGAMTESTMSARFRLLPRVPQVVQQQLVEMGREESPEVRYLFGFSELQPIALDGVCMARGHGDTLSAPAALIRPFAAVVRSVLSEWDFVSDYGVPSRRLEIVSGGVSEEPLYEPVLRAVGLDEEDVGNLSEYYRLYVP